VFLSDRQVLQFDICKIITHERLRSKRFCKYSIDSVNILKKCRKCHRSALPKFYTVFVIRDRNDNTLNHNKTEPMGSAVVAPIGHRRPGGRVCGSHRTPGGGGGGRGHPIQGPVALRTRGDKIMGRGFGGLPKVLGPPEMRRQWCPRGGPWALWVLEIVDLELRVPLPLPPAAHQRHTPPGPGERGEGGGDQPPDPTLPSQSVPGYPRGGGRPAS